MRVASNTLTTALPRLSLMPLAISGVPCTAVWRDDTSTLVACDGAVTPCDVDADCPDSQWCRATEHVALESHGHGHVRRQCVPYALPLRECGGYTLPWLFEKCAPGLTCVPDSVRVAPRRQHQDSMHGCDLLATLEN